MKQFCKNCGAEIVRKDDVFFEHLPTSERCYSAVYCTDDPDDPDRATPKSKEDYIKDFINEKCV